MKQAHRFLALTFFVLCAALYLAASDQIPATAWRIPIGQPPANPGGRKPELTNIDDGFWQGAPVGGIGAGTFSRSYRGNFERWHIKAGVHKYQNVPANQFAVFVQPEGEAASGAGSFDRQAGGRSTLGLELVLSGGRRRLRRALSEVMVCLSLASTSRHA